MSTVIDPVTSYAQVEKMLYSIAHKFSSTYPIEFSEALSECNRGYMRACEIWDASRGPFSSCVYLWAWGNVKDLVMKRSSHAAKFTFVEVQEEMMSAEPHAFGLTEETRDAIESLSEDAREIIDLLLETPTDLIGCDPVTPKGLLERVKGYLRKKRGMTHDQVNQAHREILFQFQQAWAIN